MSATDASEAWTLRCEVREKLIEFIKREYPQALPRVRAELHQLEDSSGYDENSKHGGESRSIRKGNGG